jgi:hypothetical protein
MSYLIQVNSELFAKVTFEVVAMPDNDYNIEVSSTTWIDSEDNQVFLSDYDHEGQKALLDETNEAIDAYIDANHEALYKMSAKGTVNMQAKGWLH